MTKLKAEYWEGDFEQVRILRTILDKEGVSYEVGRGPNGIVVVIEGKNAKRANDALTHWRTVVASIEIQQ